MARELWLRGDGGPGIGLGHVARLAALAREAAGRGYACRFALNADPAARALVAARGFADVVVAPEALDDEIAFLLARVPPAPLVTDLRGREPSFYRRLREAGVVVAAVDDMGQETAARLVINGDADPSYARYREVWPPQRFLVGTAYTPLEPAYAAEPPPADDPARDRLLITFGGADADDFTRRALAAVEDLAPMAVDVALGPAYGFVDAVRAVAAASRHDVRVHAPAAAMIALYRRARVALAAGGVTQHELLACGVPTVSVPHVAREKAECDAFAAAGAVVTFGPDELRPGGGVPRAVAALWPDAGRRLTLAAAGRRLVDGRGTARIMDELEAIIAAR